MRKMAKAVTLVTCTRETPGSNLSQGTDYTKVYGDVPLSIQANARITSLLSFDQSYHRGTRLRHYATSRKVAGSSPDVVGFFFSLSLSLQFT
jgi:hypothetical protein